MAIGIGYTDHHLTDAEVRQIVAEATASLAADGQRVLIIIPDGTRTMPMPLMFNLFEEMLGPRVAALDYLVALGTHQPMTDAQLGKLVGRQVVAGRAGGSPHLQPRVGRPGQLPHHRRHPRHARSRRSPAA